MGDIGWVTGGIMMTLFLGVIFSMYAVHNAELGVVCDAINTTALHGNGTALDIYNTVAGNIGIFFSPCSGLPWWVYLLILLPFIIGVAVWLIPFVGT